MPPVTDLPRRHVLVADSAAVVLQRQSPDGSPTTSTSDAISESNSDSSSKSDSSGGVNTTALVIGLAVAVTALGMAVLLIIMVRMIRRRHQNPRYVPTMYLKNKWVHWNPNRHSRRNGAGLERNTSYESVRNGRRSNTTPPNFDTASANAVVEANDDLGGGGIGRNTSIRSVMTLPAYNPKPLAHEQVLGREGERGGIDTVIEYPETAEEQEARREEEMESLYQVRQARRREALEREERRRLRHEARERNDWVALEEIRRQAREQNSSNASQSVEMLRAEHERIRERDRQVGSVAYGDLGVARHDGTRLRANSEESERTGLLGDAASIAASSRGHGRHQSMASVLSTDSNLDDFGNHCRPESPLRGMGGAPGSARNGPEMAEMMEDIPIHSPPGYDHVDFEDPPVYTSPVRTRAPQFPNIAEQAPVPDRPSIAEESPVQIRRRAATILGPDAGRSIDRRAAAVLGTPASPPPNSSAIGTPTDRRAAAVLGTPASPPPGAGRGFGRVATSPPAMAGHDRKPSRGLTGPPSANDGERSARGVGGVPQLPSLRLSALPSIVVDASSPVNPRRHSSNPSST